MAAVVNHLLSKMCTHWGDLPIIPETASGIAAIEREQMTKPRPMEVEGPHLHQPSSKHNLSTNELSSEFSSIDPMTIHTIKLMQHARRVRLLTHSVQQQQENMKGGDGETMLSFPSAPVIPEYHSKDVKHKLKKPIPFMEKDTDNPFLQGKGVVLPELDSTTVRQLLRKSVAAICAHTGYDNTTESVLETLTDIVHEYNLRVCRLLRVSVDREAQTGRTGFSDVVEEVFQKIGIGSLTTLHDFYQSRVINYHSNMVNICNKLLKDYEKVKNPADYKQFEDIKPKIKEEPVQEIQFPVSDEIDEHQESHEQLLHLDGLQNLETNFEHETPSQMEEEASKWQALPVKTEHSDNNMPVNTLDPDDEIINVNDPPSNVTSEVDSIHEPSSITVSDIMSPPSAGSKTARPPKKKRKR